MVVSCPEPRTGGTICPPGDCITTSTQWPPKAVVLSLLLVLLALALVLAVVLWVCARVACVCGVHL